MTAAVPTVLHTVHALPASAGGPARTVPALCEAVARTDRYRVVLLLTRRPGETNLRPDPDLVETVELDTPARPPRAALRRAFRERIAELHDRCRFAAVHDHGQWLATNRAAADAAAKFNIPRVVAPRGMLSPWARSHRKWAKRAAWWAFARRDLNAADAPARHQRTRSGRTPRPRRPPADRGDPQRRARPRPAAGRTAGRGRRRRPREALFLSRVHPKKGLPDLIDAWATLSAEGVAKGWRLRIVGPDELGHRAELERRAAAAGLGDAVTFEGPVPDAAKWALYARASLFLLPTHSENFGVVVAEALACGTPALTTTAAPWSLLESERCGWWADPGSAPVAAALRDALARSPADLADMGARGREAVRERFGWPKIGRATADLYDRVSPPVRPPAGSSRDSTRRPIT